jgi:predicted outer membrane lipoprotein
MRRLTTMNNNRLLGLLLAIALVALGVLAYLHYERTKTIAKIDVPGVSGEITKKGVDIEIGKPKK